MPLAAARNSSQTKMLTQAEARKFSCFMLPRSLRPT